MVSRGVAVCALLAACAWACFPPALDDTGTRCDDMRPCETGELCFDGVCGRIDELDAGPANWLTNPSFEDLTDGGDIVGWHWGPTNTGRIVVSDPSTSHSGLRSARVFTRDGGDTPRVVTQPPPVENTFPGDVWCARAWVRSNRDAGVAAALLFREFDGGLTLNSSTPASRPRVYLEWQQLEEHYLTVGAPSLELRVSFSGIANRGEILWVDDAELKRSVTLPCIWP